MLPRSLAIAWHLIGNQSPMADRKYYKRDKFIIWRKYGKKCKCCGESNRHFLTLDHVNNDGNVHRKELGRSTDVIHRWIIRNKFPDTIQLLCWNCNWGKKKWGECPHTLFSKKLKGLNGGLRPPRTLASSKQDEE